MNKDLIEIGGVYSAKVTGELAPVRIDREHEAGGWCATNLKTNRPIRIRSASQLRRRIEAAGGEGGERSGKARPPRSGEKKSSKQRKAGRAASSRPANKTSCLDAAAEVLREAGEPMACGPMIERILERNLWATKGKTPAATLSAAILREIGSKGEKAHFRKVGRGRFALAQGATR